MSVRATVLNKDRLVIHVPADTPLTLMRQWGEDVAEIVDARIAKDFENERGAGKALAGVTVEHEQRKARDGLMLEKGHMYGDLQDALDSGGFWRVIVRRGRIDITWREGDLQNAVPHAGYYAEQKVRGGKLLIVLKKDAATAQRYINARLQEIRRAA